MLLSLVILSCGICDPDGSANQNQIHFFLRTNCFMYCSLICTQCQSSKR